MEVGNLVSRVDATKDDDSTFKEYVKWRVLNPDEPLFLPMGSVRGLLALGILIICGYLLVTSKSVPEWFIATSSSIFTYYFTSRKQTQKK